METNRLNIITADSADDENKCKRKWIKPEVEVISKDLIKNGSVSSYTEGKMTSGGFLSGAGLS
jgi:hypothetical protein